MEVVVVPETLKAAGESADLGEALKHLLSCWC